MRANSWLWAVVLVSCGTPNNGTDGGAGGSAAGGRSSAGGSVAGGMSAGGSTAGGSTAGGMTAGGSSGGATAGGSAGGASAGGSTADGGPPLDPSLLFGELCDPSLLQGLLTSCRVEPQNPFSATRCLGARWADGGMLTRQEQTEVINQGSVEACSIFGARRLRCVAPGYPACVAERADGGFGTNAITAAIAFCDDLLGTRFDATCQAGCDGAKTTCAMACDRTVAETCAPCHFGCGREYARCARACLVLPDAGYPDAG